MSFRSLAVFDPYWDATTIDRTVLTLQGNVYSGGLCLTDSVVHDITISNQPSSTAFLRIDPGYAYLQAQQLDTAGNWSDAGCVALTQLSDDGDYITATRLKARKAYATCGAIVEATVLSTLLTPGTLLSGIRLAAIPKAQLMTQQFSTPVYFHYDVPPTPAFVTPLAASITGSITIFSGVHTYIAGAGVTVTGTASGVVSYFYNSAHGIAALSGPVIAPVDYTWAGQLSDSLRQSEPRHHSAGGLPGVLGGPRTHVCSLQLHRTEYLTDLCVGGQDRHDI